MTWLASALVLIALPLLLAFAGGVWLAESYQHWRRSWTAKAKKLERRASRDL